ncbi:hypothetical protein EDB83DRAFT_1563086 [Lactarius deliciosus]|nr:hypothetical protein EDB83DRAFT_1563086 [Lactarius deliciosus]
MSSSPKTSSSSSDFVSILDAALSEYNKKTGKDLLGQPLTADLGRCASVDDILTILQHHANAFEQFRRGDHRLMKWIGSSVHVFDALSATFSESIGLAFPPAKAIFVGIGVLLSVAKDVRDSHDVLVGLFERIGDFFRRFSVYVQNTPAIELAEVLVKVVVELVGRTDIEDALKRLENLIQEEHRMATAQVLRDTSGLKDDVETVRITVQQIADNTDEVKWEQIQQSVRKWFSPPDPSTNHNIACEAFHERTATWFFEGNMFMDWMSIGSLLWIHGKPGSGKSVLCSAIIQRIIEFRKTKPASLAYFYFDFRDKDKQNVRNFVTSLLIQLSAHSTSCCDVLSRVYSEHGNGAQQPANGVLINCLKKMLRVSAEHPVYIIVDALDECPDLSGMPTQREAVLDLVEDLVRQHLPNLHICVTSRTEIDIKTRLEPLASNAVSLHDESGQKQDISDYVSSVMYSDRKLQRLRDEDKKLAVELLSEKADGM